MVKKIHTAGNSTSNSTSNGATPKSAKGRSGKGQSAAPESTLSSFQNSALATSVKESAQHIWLAGMGAFSKAQEEGTKVFEALVKEGQSLQRKTQAVAEEKIGEVTGKMTAMADTVSSKAGQNWDKLETIFEARTAKALNTLGVPTAKDVMALTERVDQLASAVAKLSRSMPKAAAPAKTVSKTTSKVAPKSAPKAAPKAASKRAAKAPVVEAFVPKLPAKRARKTAAASAAV